MKIWIVRSSTVNGVCMQQQPLMVEERQEAHFQSLAGYLANLGDVYMIMPYVYH